MCLSHERKASLSSDMIIFQRNVKIHQDRYSVLLMTYFSSLQSFSLSPLCRAPLETHIQRISGIRISFRMCQAITMYSGKVDDDASSILS